MVTWSAPADSVVTPSVSRKGARLMGADQEMVIKGTGNVFADLGLPDPALCRLKADVVILIRDEAEHLGLSEIELARAVGLSPAEVSRLLRGQVGDCSLERMLGYLTSLGVDVDVTVRARTGQLRGRNGNLPTLASVAVGGGWHEVIVDWSDGPRAGTSDVIDLGPLISTHAALRPLRDDSALFASVRLSEHADAIEWGPDDALAVSGATLERLAAEAVRASESIKSGAR